MVYNRKMIKLLVGGKQSEGWVKAACVEYEKRLKKPFEINLEVLSEERLAKKLKEWPFSGREWVVVADERGEMLDSKEFSNKLERAFVSGRTVVIIIGGAYGFDPEVRAKANLVWSFSRLVFPHMLMRVMMMEQIYRAQEIARGGNYHHE